METLRVLVTGGSGFIGSHIVQSLRGAGHEVYVLDIAADPSECRGSVTRPAFVTHSFERARPDVVVHLAAIASVPECERCPRRAIQTNFLGTCTVAELCKSAGARLILASSAAVYDTEIAGPMKVKDAPHPRSVYGMTKLFSEEIVKQAVDDYAILRLFNVYGESCNQSFVIPDLIRRIRRSKSRLGVYGTGSESRDFVYIHDVVDAFQKAILGRCAGTYNVGSGTSLPIRELVTLLLREMNRTALRVSFMGRRIGDYRSNWAALGQLNTLPGWEPKTALRDGIRLTIAGTE